LKKLKRNFGAALRLGFPFICKKIKGIAATISNALLYNRD
jgi:hypothetical protein